MESRELGNEPIAPGTPEDVAALFSWANMHGAKYRDFSASRREYRAQVRYRAAQALLERELKAQAVAEAAAAEAERVALAATNEANSQFGADSQALRVHALRQAEAAARRNAAERMEAARRGEAAARAAAIAEREEREIAEAHASAELQAAVYAEAEARRRELAGPQPRGPLLGETGDPYGGSPVHTRAAREEGSEDSEAEDGGPEYGESEERESWSRPRLHSDSFGVAPPSEDSSRAFLRLSRDVVPLHPLKSDHGAFGARQIAPLRVPEEVVIEDEPHKIEAEPYKTEAEPDHAPAQLLETVGDEGLGPAPLFNAEVPLDPEPDRRMMERALERVAGEDAQRAATESNPSSHREMDAALDEAAERVGPAWLYAAPQTPPTQTPPTQTVEAVTPSPVGDALYDSHERVAPRWFGLKDAFEPSAPELPVLQPLRPGDTGTPLLMVFSLAGGVGKTSLVATLGRALSVQGEKVLLTDTNTHGMLPFYFGVRELHPGVVRTFSPPEGAADAAISLVGYPIESQTEGERPQETERRQQLLIDDIFHATQGNNRVVLDVPAGGGWLIRGMVNLHPAVLVPIAPDMNSVISLRAAERFFQGIADSDGRPLLPFYVLNQFDAALPLHLDVREVFRKQLGDRLLDFVIRSSPAVSEALAEGMTVVDYVPDTPISRDYFNLATWFRNISPPLSVGAHSAHWSGR